MSANARMPDAPGLSSLPLDSLKSSMGGLVKAVGGLAVNKVTDKVGGVAQRLTDYAEGSASSGVRAAAAGAKGAAKTGSPVKGGLKAVATAATGLKEKAGEVLSGRGGGNGKAFKFNNIVETIDVGAPVDVVYDAWTDYDHWPDFMKRVEHAELDPDEGKVTFKGQVLWANRTWETTITHQDPGRRIVWTSTGAKGHLSGAVTFHPLADELTRIVLVVEYHPKGFVEKSGNVVRALNRRLRLELKYFVRHVMTDVVLHPQDFEGYRAEIDDGQIVRSHDEVVEEEAALAEAGEDEEPEPEDEYEEVEPQEETEEPQDEEEPRESEPEDEYGEEDYEEAEYEEEPEEVPSRSR